MGCESTPRHSNVIHVVSTSTFQQLESKYNMSTSVWLILTTWKSWIIHNYINHNSHNWYGWYCELTTKITSTIRPNSSWVNSRNQPNHVKLRKRWVRITPNMSWGSPPKMVKGEGTHSIDPFHDPWLISWSLIVITIWLFNVAMENHHFSMGKPSISMGHFPWLC